jgi:arylamine N-acetyltransferase
MLMMDALRAIGFGVQPLLARVRWNKAADAQTTFTHMVLRVTWPLQSDDDASQAAAAAAAPSSSSSPAYLVDVAFGGIGPLSPLVLGQVLLLPLLLLSKIQHFAPVQPPSAFQSIPYFKP